ncbi:MAG: hypothetical protein ACREV9_03060 [Burkholderiales bacterium]
MELVIASGLGLLLGAGALSFVQLSTRSATRRHELRIRQTVNKCFGKSGLEVEVSCIKRGDSFLVFIESEPSKKMRFSYVKEQALVQHVERTTGQKIERIFWRFRMKDKEGEGDLNAPGNADAMPTPREGEFDERKPMRAGEAAFKVDEVAWDNFAEFVHQSPTPSVTQTQFDRIVAAARST